MGPRRHAGLGLAAAPSKGILAAVPSTAMRDCITSSRL